MTVKDFLSMYDMNMGKAKASVVRKIMGSGDAVGPELAYELTGKPDQWLTIRQALKLSGCLDEQS